MRITNNPKKVDMEDELQKNLFLKTRFTDFLKYAKSDFGRGIAEQMLIKVEERISHFSAQKNKKAVVEHISNLQTLNGSFSNLGMWKLKSKLLPRPRDPPMAKKDGHGNLITSKGALKKLYLDTYVHRLRNREMKSEYSDILELKTALWGERLRSLKVKHTPNWTLADLDSVIKSLKKNQTRDPSGLINELFLPGVMGQDMKSAIISLMNGVRQTGYFPPYMELADICTIYKLKGSRLDMSSDRGIFILSVLRKIFDKLIYRDKYDDIANGMSDSNIGAQKKKNIRNHLFIVYGVINSVLKEGKSCLDIQIYDLVQAFDALWLTDCMNDLYDTLPVEQQDEKLALMYTGNKNTAMAVNTAVGQTDRVTIKETVQQGGVFGPIMCSNSIDTVGKICYERGENLFLYKQTVKVLPLAMCDDLLAMSVCGHQSLSLNTYINAKIEMKKLKFHTPDKNGKTKCHKMHIGRPNKMCPKLEVHGTPMKEVQEDTYLGDIISSDGRNQSNIKSRVGKGLGKINDIMTMLEKVTFGEHYFSTAILLRESTFINSVLGSAECWYILTKDDIKQLENVDVSLLRQVSNAPISVPIEALYLELGVLNIETIVKARRLNYLHYLIKLNP